MTKNRLMSKRITLGTADAATANLFKCLERDRELYEHCSRVSKFAVLIAEEMGLSAESQKEIQIAGLFHDVGKLSIPKEILHKTILNTQEWEMIKTHSRLGKDILEKSKFLSKYSTWAHYHHERFDGGGYPEGLEGEEIPIEARIISVADCLDAMISHRPYRKNSFSIIETVHEIKSLAGSKYDPQITEALEKLCNQKLASILFCLF